MLRFLQDEPFVNGGCGGHYANEILKRMQVELELFRDNPNNKHFSNNMVGKPVSKSISDDRSKPNLPVYAFKKKLAHQDDWLYKCTQISEIEGKCGYETNKFQHLAEHFESKHSFRMDYQIDYCCDVIFFR